MINAIANGLLYAVFSILVGYSILQLKKQHVLLNKKLLIFLVLTLPLLSFVPVLLVSYQISVQYESSFLTTMLQVITSYKIGDSWVLTLGVSIVLFIILKQRKFNTWLFFVFTIVAVFTVSLASHSASLEPFVGYLSNSFHFLAAVSWIGVLFVMSFFTKSEDNWSTFIRWFSPLALVAVIVLVVTGFMMMIFIVPEYVNSWALTYGQLLLLKHLVFIPLILFGFTHGFLLRKRLEKGYWTFRKTLRVEALIGLFVFVLTAMMTESTPPHEVSRTISQDGVSLIASLFIQPDTTTFAGLSITFGWQGFVGLGIGAVIMIYFLYAIVTSPSGVKMIVLSIGIIGSLYLAFMISLGERDQVFNSVEKAVQSYYGLSDQVNILIEQPFQNEQVAVLYEVNNELLSAALVMKIADDQYSLLPSTVLTVGGGLLDQEKHKIRTFIQREGSWLKDANEITYITVGFINEPSDVAKVQIHYEGEMSMTPVVNNGFLNVISSKEEYRPLHPIDFYDNAENIIGGYLRQGMEEEMYCH